MPKRKRREYGSGSIYKNADGSFTAQSARDAAGKIRRSRCATRAEAEQLLKDWQQAQGAGVDIRAAGGSVEAFANEWINVVAPELKPKTLSGYQHLFESHILPTFGAQRLDAVNAEAITRWLNTHFVDVADTTRLRAFNLFKQMLEAAEAWHRIARNPAAHVKPPKVKKAEARAFTLAEAQALLKATAGHRLEALYHLALVLGIRLGELLGLLWEDYDPAQRLLKITQQAQTIRGRTAIEESTKTLSSARVLPVPPQAARLLEAQRQRLARESEHADWKEHGLIFPSEVGTPMGDRSLGNNYAAARRRAGIPDEMNFHKLRHSCATFLAEQGETELIIAFVLGHSGGGITRRYVHPPLPAMRRAVQFWEETLMGKGFEEQQKSA